ncbi:MBL fold metallo-hydrolase [Brevundimonas bullata]|uniref:MBL fold metallo-hydrolase n=1 Tax=Brevundimonas bullata TaxID=13160 RepID=UPI000E0BB0AA|nr:MBL fold metallo-hydrolase [Brevundimonas bullata]WQE36032.1 MBL fold metallo-hydrolase [Brevundimonas bullata]
MIRSASLITLAALAAALTACSPPADKTPAADASAAATTVAASPDVHPFTIGALQAYALLDGRLTVPNDSKTLGVGRTQAEVSAVLTAAGLSADKIDLDIQPLLVRDGERVVLFDTGAGSQMGTEGKLLASLRAAGVEPAQITDILISHGHGDHVGGLLDASGALVFPNAAIRMTAAEWAALKANKDMAALVAGITPKVQTFQPGAQVLPNILAVAVNGHTPGHTAYEITSGDQSLLYIGDTAHHSVISVQQPDWTIAFDGDAPTAQASRKALLQGAAERNTRIYAVHFPWPGLGRVTKQGETLVWTPES